MAYVGIEFESDGENDAGEIAIVNKVWLTPMKRRVHWPSYSQPTKFESALRSGEEPGDTWMLYPVKRIFFETARQKLKTAEVTSDVQSDTEFSEKRKRVPPPRLSYDSEEESVATLPRPPRFSLDKVNQQSSRQSYSQPEPRSSPSTHVNKKNCFRTIPSSPSSCADAIPSSPSSCADAINRQRLPTRSPLAVRGEERENLDSKVVVPLLLHIKEQNNQILSWIKKQSNTTVVHGTLPDDIPVKFPLCSIDSLTVLESYLMDDGHLAELAAYFSSLGGRDIGSKTNIILKNIFNNELAQLYSFYGSRGNKKAFNDLRVKTVIIRAVQLTTSNTTAEEISAHIKVWLKHAPQRLSNSLQPKKNCNQGI
ncbi:uncharacterized protein LOC116182729 isoform X2 [Photinus pyralis]|uniref:uncharacterized protein LOC116160412 isoform X2 n=1 Tax=Photinus pyralis TaxID=7054 RepID=UPI0012675185|nr:uncharacterized protein LOC116160412 isoform X2 [Photinus pyralis]XP_031359134.1 uncharacterized protein LOC116182729 isoform X2 [Photinus pyralis]